MEGAGGVWPPRAPAAGQQQRCLVADSGIPLPALCLPGDDALASSSSWLNQKIDGPQPYWNGA